jgi:hypothetical protein
MVVISEGEKCIEPFRFCTGNIRKEIILENKAQIKGK